MADLLYETQANPMPANATSGMLQTPDGKNLRYAHFKAEARPLKGTVVIVPGRNEFIEKYFETIRDLSARGFGSAIYDLRGQGMSDRLLKNPHRGHVDDFNHYANDLDYFFSHIVLPDCRGPFYILAHSTGGLISLVAAPNLANRVERMVLTAPLLGMKTSRFSMRSIRLISSTLHAIGFGATYVNGGPPSPEPTPFDKNVLTSDPARYARNTDIVRQYPQLAIGGPTASWVRAVCRAIDKVNQPDFIERLSVPVLFIGAGTDRVVVTDATQSYAAQLKGSRLLTVYGAQHELLQERDEYREQVLAAFDAFIPGSNTMVASDAL